MNLNGWLFSVFRAFASDLRDVTLIRDYSLELVRARPETIIHIAVIQDAGGMLA